MSWSSQGSVATYPTVNSTGNPATTTSTSLAFRADVAAGIVYVTGSFVVLANSATANNPVLLAAPLPATFRPKAAALLSASGRTNSNATTSPTVQVAADGTVTMVGSSGLDFVTGGPYSLRAFYFLTVTPA